MSRGNPFIQLIKAGRIKTTQQLRGAYRALVMKSHPDAVGSESLLETYLSLSMHYQEALRALGAIAASQGWRRPRENHRLAYFQLLQRLERIDKPYAFHRRENLRHITELKTEALLHFCGWDGNREGLFRAADRDYDRLKGQKLSGPYMNDALAANVSPVFHNIVGYHLTGMLFYKKQVRQNLAAVLDRLAKHGCQSLKEFIELLIADMEHGPAVFGDGRTDIRVLPAGGG